MSVTVTAAAKPSTPAAAGPPPVWWWLAARAWVWVWPPVAVFLVFVAAWWMWVDVRDLASIVLPHPAQVLDTFTTRSDTLARNAAVTGVEAGLGYLLGTTVALLAGVVISLSSHTVRGVLPWLFATEAMPKIAFGPLLILWLGFDRAPKVVMAAMMCVFIVMYNTVNGLRRTPVELVDLSRSLAASRTKTYVKIRFPNALPSIFVGLKIGAPLALIGAVIGEFLSADAGLGWIIITAVSDTPLVFATLAVLSVMSMALTGLIAGLERLMLPWVRAVNT